MFICCNAESRPYWGTVSTIGLVVSLTVTALAIFGIIHAQQMIQQAPTPFAALEGKQLLMMRSLFLGVGVITSLFLMYLLYKTKCSEPEYEPLPPLPGLLAVPPAGGALPRAAAAPPPGFRAFVGTGHKLGS